MKVVFFGSSDFIEPVREVIKNNFELTEDVKNCDLIVVASYGKILTSEVLSLPKYGVINIHPSDLPKYRGSSPIQSQILDGVKNSFVTFIKMDEKVDHGPILKKIPFEILEDDTFQSVANKVFKLAADNLVDVIQRYINNQIDTRKQDDSQATFTKILKKDNGFIDINNPPSPENIDRMVRAYFPWPGVWGKYQISNIKYQIFKLLPDKKIQVEGKMPMSYKDFVNGYKDGGEILKKLNLQV